MSRATQILNRLQGVRPSRDGWIARCPAHEDRSPSLSIKEGNGGRILVHCFSGCTIEAICAAIGIKVADLFSESRPYEPRPSILRKAERQIAGLRSRLTPRDRVLPVTIVYCDPQNLDAGIARVLALGVEGELVQAVLEPCE